MEKTLLELDIATRELAAVIEQLKLFLNIK